MKFNGGLWKFLYTGAVMMIMGLVLFEPPTDPTWLAPIWVRELLVVASPDRPFGNQVTTSIEAICLGVLFLRTFQLGLFVPRDRYWRDPKIFVMFAVIAVR